MRKSPVSCLALFCLFIFSHPAFADYITRSNFGKKSQFDTGSYSTSSTDSYDTDSGSDYSSYSSYADSVGYQTGAMIGNMFNQMWTNMAAAQQQAAAQRQAEAEQMRIIQEQEMIRQAEERRLQEEERLRQEEEKRQRFEQAETEVTQTIDQLTDSMGLGVEETPSLIDFEGVSLPDGATAEQAASAPSDPGLDFMMEGTDDLRDAPNDAPTSGEAPKLKGLEAFQWGKRKPLLTPSVSGVPGTDTDPKKHLKAADFYSEAGAKTPGGEAGNAKAHEDAGLIFDRGGAKSVGTLSADTSTVDLTGGPVGQSQSPQAAPAVRTPEIEQMEKQVEAYRTQRETLQKQLGAIPQTPENYKKIVQMRDQVDGLEYHEKIAAKKISITIDNLNLKKPPEVPRATIPPAPKKK